MTRYLKVSVYLHGSLWPNTHVPEKQMDNLLSPQLKRRRGVARWLMLTISTKTPEPEQSPTPLWSSISSWRLEIWIWPPMRGKRKSSRTKKGHTEMLVSLLGHVRLDDRTCFEVDPASNYEITKVRARDTRRFFLHGRALFFCIFRQNMGGVNLAKHGMILRTSPQPFFQQ